MNGKQGISAMKRFIFLVSVLSLPLFPAPVLCAWVLWQQTITDHPAAPLDCPGS